MKPSTPDFLYSSMFSTQYITPYISGFTFKILLIQLILVLTSKVTLGCYKSLFSFGDSVVDTGNSIYLSPPDDLPICAFRPYGNTYFHHPTGRFCDGRLIVDFIAEYLGLPLVPPYFGQTMHNLKQGVNFAVGGASALDASFYQEMGLPVFTKNSLKLQLNLFKKLLPTLCSKTSGLTGCNEFLGNSFILMGNIGGNDYGPLIIQGISIEEVRGLVPLVTEAISMAVKEVIELGAVTVMVPGLLPLGCSPAMLTYIFGKAVPEDYEPSTGCLTWANKFTEYHHEQLQVELSQIQELHPHAKIIYADYYNAVMRLNRSPHEFGFTGSGLKACCGEGEPYNYNFGAMCGENQTTCCDDPSKYISWDGVHYTEAANELIFKAVFEGPSFSPHFNASCTRVAKCLIYKKLDMVQTLKASFNFHGLSST